MSNLRRDTLRRLYAKFIAKAEYYERHPYFPSYCMNASATAYRRSAEMVLQEAGEHGTPIEEICSGEQAESRPDGEAPAPRGLPGGGEEVQRGPGKEEG